MEEQSKLDKALEVNDPIHEVLKKPSSWIVNYGNLIFLLIFLFFVTIACFIKYPIVVRCEAKIISINGPKTIVSKGYGKLVKLKVKEAQYVRKGDVIGFMESIGNHEQILALYGQVNAINELLDKNEPHNRHFPELTSYQELGEIQQAYQQFSQAMINFNDYLANGFFFKKKNILIEDINHLSHLTEQLKVQEKLYEQDLSLMQHTFDSNQSLKDNQAISDFEFRVEKSKLINKKLLIPQISAAIIRNEYEKNDKQKEILELENNMSRQKAIFTESLKTFKSQIEDWLKKYVFLSPISGKVMFANFLEENQEIKMDQVICYIHPANSEYYAEAYIPQTNFGKIEKGQRVLLKFPSYPYQEYGIVEGTVEFISQIGTDQGYLSKIHLPKNLSTSTDKKMEYREGLVADAEIITNDMKLIERFYYKIKTHLVPR